ncbi:MAG: DUF1501 domain-containing protein [Verrucomicrobiales bacterium]
MPDALNRKHFLYRLGSGLGSLALTHLLKGEEAPASAKPHHPARAKRCIFLMMEGGPSHIDTFDPKPALDRLHLQAFQRKGDTESAMSSGKRYYVKSPFEFLQAGQSGAAMNTAWTHLKQCADDICFYRGAQAESVNHPTACYHLNTGNRFGGDPAMGSWVSYGLGSLNENLPSFVVLPRSSFPQGGAANWSNGFLPAIHQGTALRAEGSPILDLQPPKATSQHVQKQNLALLQRLNQMHLESSPNPGSMQARMASYQMAFRMQTEVPGVLSLENESRETRQLYGVDDPTTSSFGSRCLLARKLVEEGVRFVQVYAGNWDSHDYIHQAHGHLIQSVDRPIAGLLRDLKRRGLLDETLVVFAGEFGRTPDNGMRGGGKSYGRDHNAKAMTLWLAGGGVRAGSTVGATDPLGASAIEEVHPLRDVHVTLLHLLGLDDAKLTYFHAGRFKQLSQFGGEIIRPLIG